MNAPMVSVVVGVYNKERQVGECLRSVLAQTCRDYELIVVEDCSTDGNLDGFQGFRDSRIRLVRREANSGLPAVPRNQAIHLARGKHLAFLDADVVVAWTGGALEEGLVPESVRGRDFIWTGKLSLPRLVAVMEKAEVWVGNDRGPLHVAAAVGCQTVSVWRPTEPAKWGPKGERHRQIRKMTRCEGCESRDWRKKCLRERHDCMKLVASPEVVAECSSVLRLQGKESP